MDSIIIDGKKLTASEVERLILDDNLDDWDSEDCSSEQEDYCEIDTVEEEVLDGSESDNVDCNEEEQDTEDGSENDDDIVEREFEEGGPTATKRRKIEIRQKKDHSSWFTRQGENIIIPKKAVLTGRGDKNKKWSTKHPEKQKTPARNVTRVGLPGPKGKARVVTSFEETWRLYFTDDMLNDIVKFTNIEIASQRENYKDEQSFLKDISKIELEAFIGLLYVAGARKDNHMNADYLWGPCGSSIYVSIMSLKRFRFITNCLRFDDKATRQTRKVGDPFTSIRSLWDQFFSNCLEHYKPSVELTIDEQLLGFRGRCKFRMYIANKPEKYGLKLVFMCDAHSKYLLTGIPYVGKDTYHGDEPFAQHLVKELAKPVYNTNSNITTDNWFTSFPLLSEMLGLGVTMVGTVRRNKKEVPIEMLQTKGRPENTNIFLYDSHTKQQLISYCPKKGKVVLLASTMHYKADVSEETKKPVAIEFYNETKGGVDSFDQMCKNYSCSRRTRRWPMAIFYGLLNAAGINAFVIWSYVILARGQKKINRFEFLHQLGLDLAKTFMQQRLTVSNLPQDLRLKIQAILRGNNSLPPTAQDPNQQRPAEGPKQGRCKLCHKSDKKFSVKCSVCRNFVCGEHREITCKNCTP